MSPRPNVLNHNLSDNAGLGPVWTLTIPYPSDIAVSAVVRMQYKNFHGGTDLPGPHVHDGIELGVIHTGRGLFMIGDKRLVFRAGDICIIDGRVPHVAFYATACVCTWISFDFSRLFAPLSFPFRVLTARTFADPGFSNIFSLRNYPGMRRTIAGLVDEFDKKQPCHNDMIRSLLLGLMAYLERLRISGDHHFTSSGSPVDADEVSLKQLGPALDFIHAHYAECIGNDDLARNVSMSTTAFRRLFRRLLGMPPHGYLTMYRLRIACAALVNTREKMDAIAQECGFEDVSSFRRAFKKGMGTTPGAWRRNQRNPRL